jgi:hypothetical protein
MNEHLRNRESECPTENLPPLDPVEALLKCIAEIPDINDDNFDNKVALWEMSCGFSTEAR